MSITQNVTWENVVLYGGRMVTRITTGIRQQIPPMPIGTLLSQHLVQDEPAALPRPSIGLKVRGVVDARQLCNIFPMVLQRLREKVEITWNFLSPESLDLRDQKGWQRLRLAGERPERDDQLALASALL
ncbi:hypothetical protein GGR40_002540 [Novosphingobium gossypii]